MAKLLRFKDKFLLGLGLLGDIFEQGKDPGGLVSSAYSQLYGFVPTSYKKSNFYTHISKLQRTGYLEKVVKNGVPYLRLTSTAKEDLYRDFPMLSLQKKKWDKKWRVVVFDIEERKRRKRNVLREKLRELGFGMIQESVWISPYDFLFDLREFLEEHNLDQVVFVMEVILLLAGDQFTLANRIWNLDQFNERYKVLYEKMIKGKFDVGSLWQSYCDLLFIDPLLPKELLPKPWYGFLLRSTLIKSRRSS